MANIELLKEKINNSGMTVTAIADKSGIVRETLYNRMRSGNFYASEIVALTDVLHLTRKERDDIFLP
ncbi:XRE family transcriptional regulator [Eubacterium ramulus]|uniref:XRE family transcriptional regulator n=1 Tax=Eubacterium ramulus TaxID=39490 RepID=UPI0022E1288A|nr:XRE family transcriptional regulator [Eubacterium ramulus]